LIYKCLIVGLGNIGMGYDLNLTLIQSHAKAINFHPKFDLSGAIEKDKKKRILFEKKYKKPTFIDFKSPLKLIKPHILIISTTTSSHLIVLKKILSYHKPKVIICEKPLGVNLKQSLEIIKICKKNRIKLYVNYLRLSDPGIIKIKEKISLGKIQTPVSGVVYYSRGVLNNASHFLNTLEFWFGNVIKSKLIYKGSKFSKFDFDSSFIVFFKQAKFVFIPANKNKSHTNSIEIFANNGRLLYDQGGSHIYWQNIIKKKNNPLIFHKKIYKLYSGKKNSQLHFFNNLYYSLSKKTCNICSGGQAIKTLRTIYSLYEESKINN